MRGHDEHKMLPAEDAGGKYMPNTTVEIIRDGDVEIACGRSLTEDCMVCTITRDGTVMSERYADDRVDAIAMAMIDYLAPIAVAEMWTKPIALGLSACCEDVVNWLVYEGFKAYRHGLASIALDNESLQIERDDFAEIGRFSWHAVDYVRDHWQDLGIEFEDVWS
jgi:hypothetical protein